MKALKLYEQYDREEVNAIFEPEKPYTPGSGIWGISGIISLPQPKNYVFFVTLGSKQAGHEFQEGISPDGVLTWHSQPSNTLQTPRIINLIYHDSTIHDVHLFFRPEKGQAFYYLGKLDYISHDPKSSEPVWFTWKILDWSPPTDVRNACVNPEIISTNNIPPSHSGRVRNINFSERQQRNEDIGATGENIVISIEQKSLIASGQADLAAKVCSTKERLGNAAPYDIDSFFSDGRRKYIEVKTTTGGPTMEFYMSVHERGVCYDIPRPL